MKRVIGFLAVITVLFVAIYLVTNMSQENKAKGNPFGKEKLHPETIDLLDDPNYSNIITPDQLEQKLSDGDSVTVYFYSPLCGYCMEVSPTLNKAAQEAQVNLPQYSLLEFEEGWTQFKIESIPVIIHFEDGKEVARLMGVHDSEVYKKWFEQYVK